jgi:hypothetical protein
MSKLYEKIPPFFVLLVQENEVQAFSALGIVKEILFGKKIAMKARVRFCVQERPKNSSIF